jgi:hypothetical protein
MGMQKKFLRAGAAVALALAVMCALPARAAGPVLSEKIPGDAMMYVGWQGSEALQAQYDKSNLKQIVDASQIPSFVSEKTGWVIEQIKKNDPAAADAVKVGLSISGKMWKHPTALYMGPLDLSKVDQRTPPSVRVALICQAGADADDLVKQAQPLLDKAKDAPVKIEIKKVGDTVVLTVGTLTLAEQVPLGIAEGELGFKFVPLANKPEFTAAMKEVDGDGAMVMYIDMAAVSNMIDDVIKKIPDPEAAVYGPKIMDAVNLKGMTQIAVSGKFLEKEWTDRGFIGLTGPKKGITALFDNKPLADADFKAVPKDAMAFSIFRIDLARIYDEVRTGIKSVEPKADRQVDQALGMLQGMIGINVKDDVINALGDTWTIYRLPQTPDMQVGAVLLISAKDEKKLADTIDKVNDILRDRGLPLPKEKAKLGDSEATVVKLGALELAWGVAHGKLIVSSKQGFEAAVNQLANGKDSILDNASYVAIRKTLGGGPAVAAEYGEPAKTYPEFAKAMAQLMFMARLYGVDLPNNLLPEPKDIEKYLTPGGATSWIDDKGLHAVDRAAFPGASLLGG